MKPRKFFSSALAALTFLTVNPANSQSLEEMLFPACTVAAQNAPLNQPPAAPLEVKALHLLSQKKGDGFADNRPKHAWLGEDVFLYAVLEAFENGRTVYFTDAENIRLNGRPVSGQSLRKCSQLPLSLFQWFKVEPVGNNYQYVSRRNPIKYAETLFGNGCKVKADVHPRYFHDQFPALESGLGVMRYKLHFKMAGQEISTPGKESLVNGGISKKVPQVTFTPHTNSWTDHLFGLFNTPYIWGSTPYQVDNQIGSDCADLVVFGWRKEGYQKGYTWSYGLRSKKNGFTDQIAEVSSTSKQGLLLDAHGEPIPHQKGYLLFFPRHIAVLLDDDGDGYIGCSDLGVHTLFHQPEINPICRMMGLPTEILRFRK